MEKVRRLSPQAKTLRELYLKSGNQCAFDGCHSLLMNDEGVFVGQVCHIEAAEEGGQRFNAQQTNEDRRSFSNLMLMCYEHHQVTNDIAKYTVSVLTDMKARHEQKYGDIACKMRNSIKDHTETSEIYFPKSLDCLSTTLEWKLNREELDECLSEFNEFVLDIKKIPIPTRELLVIILKRSRKLGGVTSDFGVTLGDIKHSCDLDLNTLREHLSILDDHGVIMEGDSDDFRGQPGIVFRTLPSGWPIYQDLNEFVRKTQVTLNDLFMDLRFNLLD